MFTLKHTDQKEVRRFRIAQFNGRAATASRTERPLPVSSIDRGKQIEQSAGVGYHPDPEQAQDAESALR